jgi:hypothetical protein
VVFDEYHARIAAAACLLVMSQSAQRCPSTSLLRSADYAGFLFVTDSLAQEGVSANSSLKANFPASWENTGNFSGWGLGYESTVAKKALESAPYEPIPYAS